ncbi:Mco32p TDEL_0E01810 [Torulaspora delbrueckii]|uniref:Uncharacterized protein n=1 Tax=Torulaspora delbrueckii TaxID=4950 RepID=G8ZUY0_TORDE|nr:hypothetical protein TDEL_0E01810 [Torulaspora delbrueckii]CCE92424.1 hypothetical protein TDEL_0E01810 [Torulaspora delbrueckii]
MRIKPVFILPSTKLFKGGGSIRYQSSIRHANLGEISEYLLKVGVPNMLQKSLEDRYLDENIRLRFLPTTHPYFPALQGKTKYKASLNAIRLISNKLILKKNCQLHITSATTLLRDKEDNRYNCVTPCDKLVIKWQSCLPGENIKHLRGKTTSVPQNLLSDSTPPIVDYILHPSGKKFSGEMIRDDGSLVQENLINRAVKGIFIFEFNDDNSRILVHTFEDVEMIDYDKKIQTGALAC